MPTRREGSQGGEDSGDGAASSGSCGMVVSAESLCDPISVAEVETGSVAEVVASGAGVDAGCSSDGIV